MPTGRQFACKIWQSHLDPARRLTRRAAAPKLNHMVKYQQASLDRTFAALADPTRRALLAQLDEHENVSVSELARPFPVSLPAIMKHLDVLSDAGLIVTRPRRGRTVPASSPRPRCGRPWAGSTIISASGPSGSTVLPRFLEEEVSCPPSQRPPSPASPSSGVSRPRPRRVYAAWTDPQKIVRWFGPARRRRAQAETRRPRRRPIQHRLPHRGWRTTPRQRRLSRGGAEREAGLHLGMALDARARVAGDRADQA